MTAVISLLATNKGTGAQAEFTTPGTYSWTCPAGVFSVCVVCVGGGGGWAGNVTGSSHIGGGGGGLGYKNNISVTPGTSYTVVVGDGGVPTTSGGDSYFISTATVCGRGGRVDGTGGGYVGTGGGNGGYGGLVGNNANYSGGGGAGGYSGNGGNGAYADGSVALNTIGNPGAGGGGAGGANNQYYHDGGGVGIKGQGANGVSSATSYATSSGSMGIAPVGGGSSVAGLYGGGQGAYSSGKAGNGAVRIIWGSGRSYPSTNTGDV